MSRIVQAVRGTPAQRVETERRAIADVEREIADLEQQRADKLVADDPAEAVKLAEKIAAAHRRLETHNDRLTAFLAQARRHRTATRQEQKTAALAELERKFADRAVAAANLDKAIADFAASLKAYQTICREPFSAWPHDLFPSIKIFEGMSHSYAASRIAAALRMQSPGAAHTLLTELGTRLGKLAELDIKQAASMIDDIRNSPLPKLPETSDTEGEAA
jgi:hypothetical protein